MLIRRETPQDTDAVRGVHARAFPVPDGQTEPIEVTLLAALRRSEAWLPRFSLVAAAGTDVVGHVVCSRAHVGASRHPALGLGPIGVRPDHQGRGIGSALLHAVLGAADARDEPLVALLGEPGYYGRFGFVPALDVGVEAPDPGWREYFQVRTLTTFDGAVRGRLRYAPPFDDL